MQISAAFCRFCLARTVLFLAAMPALLCQSAAVRAEPDPWPDLQREIFADRPIAENDGTLQFFAPDAAADAAVVPISIRFPAGVANDIKALTLVVDRNPAPVAASFSFGDGFAASAGLGERYLATRIRVDSFSKVRAIAETRDGRLHMVSRFVAGAGGCTAPASKDLDEAMASLGRMKVQSAPSPAHAPDWREATVMIRHPNFTGMQRDPKTGRTTPARFVRDLEIRRAGALVLRVEGGISISEDPNFRFNYSATEGDTLEVLAVDSEGTRFSGRGGDSGS